MLPVSVYVGGDVKLKKSVSNCRREEAKLAQNGWLVYWSKPSYKISDWVRTKEHQNDDEIGWHEIWA